MMKKNRQVRWFVAFTAAGVLCGWFVPVMAAGLEGNADNQYTAVVGEGDRYNEVFGHYTQDGTDANGGRVTMTGGNVEAGYYGNGVMGGRAEGLLGSDSGDANDNQVYISGGEVGSGTFARLTVAGGYSESGSAKNNEVRISGGTFRGDIAGGYSDGAGTAEKNAVWFNGTASGVDNGSSKRTLYGGYSEDGDALSNEVHFGGTANMYDIYGGSGRKEASGNRVFVDGGTIRHGVYGGSGSVVSRNQVTVTGGTMSYVYGTNVRDGTQTSLNEARENQVWITSENTLQLESAAGAYSTGNWMTMTGNVLQLDGAVEVKNAYGARSRNGIVSHNQVILEGKTQVSGSVFGGYTTYSSAARQQGEAITGNEVYLRGDASVVGTIYGVWIGDSNRDLAVTENRVVIEGGTAHGIYGGCNQGSGDAVGNSVILAGGTVDGSVYGGCSTNGHASGNTVTLTGTANAVDANLYGSNKTVSAGNSGNTLVVDNWTSSNTSGNVVQSVQNFDAIQFQNLNWKNGGVALDITGAKSANALANTSVQVDNLVFANGSAVQVGDKMTFIRSDKDTGLSLDNGKVTEDVAFSQGVATVGQLSMGLEGDTHNLVGEITEKSLAPQTLTIAENRTAAAAFLNQGADIAADSLDLLGSDYKYGLRTFGAVYGSRSTWDAAGDLKINGWSEIVGLGNVHRKGDGDLLWGVFYENGTGNYRTWNEFNNEMFRGDGSLLYNGGGAAVRYKQDNGWYYEASVRAGTLSASMDNAVKDGNGNSYGFDSDSTYWGAHAGVGKVIETEQGEWNVYGKYFHTDIDGDSFNIAGDAFTFDSLTSDRLRIGARYTADKAKRWSLYYGLAWEYEFTGDSHMKAGQWDAPEQSLGGSTGIAEIGTVWQPDDSPWQANINLKGYAGEREGVSGMVQLAYTF